MTHIIYKLQKYNYFFVVLTYCSKKLTKSKILYKENRASTLRFVIRFAKE